MARFELTGHDRYRIGQAREALAAVGRLETVLQQLLEMLDEDGGES